MLNLLVIVLMIVMLSFVFLGFNIFFRKKGFPQTEIGRNREMRKLGLTCPRCDEMKQVRKPNPAAPINPKDLKIVAS